MAADFNKAGSCSESFFGGRRGRHSGGKAAALAWRQLSKHSIDSGAQNLRHTDPPAFGPTLFVLFKGISGNFKK